MTFIDEDKDASLSLLVGSLAFLPVARGTAEGLGPVGLPAAWFANLTFAPGDLTRLPRKGLGVFPGDPPVQ